MKNIDKNGNLWYRGGIHLTTVCPQTVYGSNHWRRDPGMNNFASADGTSSVETASRPRVSLEPEPEPTSRIIDTRQIHPRGGVEVLRSQVVILDGIPVGGHKA